MCLHVDSIAGETDSLPEKKLPLIHLQVWIALSDRKRTALRHYPPPGHSFRTLSHPSADQESARRVLQRRTKRAIAADTSLGDRANGIPEFLERTHSRINTPIPSNTIP